MNFKFYTFFIAFLFVFSTTQAQITITDADLAGNTTYNWTKDNVYLLDGYVYLEAGGVLNIEAGTVIKGKVSGSNGDLSSALIITRDAQIFAEGTVDEPIIFTGELDDLTITDDLTATISQQWGGLILLGNSIVGEDGGTDVIEGIPSDETRIIYGGNDPMDNSGVLKYVSIRHGGSDIGSDNEINGLTLGGVGAGTTIDFVEVFANKDDGIELFGGTVNITHAVVAFVGDDSYDFDESWDGHMQYLLSIQLTNDGVGDNAIEYDGSEHTDQTPKTVGRLYNGTFIGSGATNSKSRGLRVKSDGAVEIWNSIFTEQVDYAFSIEGTSLDRLAAGESAFANNIVSGYGTYILEDMNDIVANALSAGNTDKDVNPGIISISREPNGNLNPLLMDGAAALTSAADHQNGELDWTSFRGAFDNNCNWAAEWTALATYGYFPAGTQQCVSVGVELAENDLGLSMAVPMPNPASTQVTLAYELPDASTVTVQLYSLAGQLVKTVQLNRQLAGSHQMDLNLNDVQTGPYVVAIETAFGTVTRKIVKVK